MIASPPGAAHSDVRVAWMFVVCVALGGYAGIVRPSERRLQELGFHAHELYDLANRNESMIEGTKPLQAARDRVKRDLAALSAENGTGKVVLGALRLLQKEARAHRITVVGLSPADTGEAGAQDVTIALHGTYRDVVLVVADLSRHDVLMRVTGVNLTAGENAPAMPEGIDAIVRATLYHGLAAIKTIAKEAGHAAAVAR